MSSFLKQIKSISLLEATLSIVFGILMIVCPNFTKATIIYLFASLTLVIGIVKTISYFLYGIEPFGVILGVAGIALAITIFACAPALVNSNIIGIIFGVILLLKSLFEIQESFDLRRLGSRYWWIDTILAALVFGFAISVICNPATERILFILLGSALIVDGILSMIDIFVVSAKVKKTKKTLKDMFAKDDDENIIDI